MAAAAEHEIVLYKPPVLGFGVKLQLQHDPDQNTIHITLPQYSLAPAFPTHQQVMQHLDGALARYFDPSEVHWNGDPDSTVMTVNIRQEKFDQALQKITGATQQIREAFSRQEKAYFAHQRGEAGPGEVVDSFYRVEAGGSVSAFDSPPSASARRRR